MIRKISVPILLTVLVLVEKVNQFSLLRNIELESFLKLR